MKKLWLVGAIALGLAGCGNANEEELVSMKEQNAQLQVQVEQLEEQVTALTEQVETSLSNTKHTETESEPEELAPFTVQTLTTDGNSYTRAELTIELKPEENEYEALLRTLFPDLLFNDVAIDTDGTITIDIHENSTGAPNMTSSAQVGIFFDVLEYTLVENFPKLKGYYLTSNNEPTYLGDAGPFEGLQPLDALTEEEMYLPIND